jgi:hypothetical protein
MLFSNDNSEKNEALERQYKLLADAEPGSEEALRIANTIETLEKSDTYRLRLSPDAVFGGLMSLGGIVLIVLAEGKDVFLSGTKAWNNVPRPKI